MHNVSRLTGFIGSRAVRQFRYDDRENAPARETGWKIENVEGVQLAEEWLPTRIADIGVPNVTI